MVGAGWGTTFQQSARRCADASHKSFLSIRCAVPQPRRGPRQPKSLRWESSTGGTGPRDGVHIQIELANACIRSKRHTDLAGMVDRSELRRAFARCSNTCKLNRRWLWLAASHQQAAKVLRNPWPSEGYCVSWASALGAFALGPRSANACGGWRMSRFDPTSSLRLVPCQARAWPLKRQRTHF